MISIYCHCSPKKQRVGFLVPSITSPKRHHFRSYHAILVRPTPNKSYNIVIVLYLKPHHHHDGQLKKWTLSNLLSNLPLFPRDCSQSSSLWLPLFANAAVHVHIGDLLGKVSRGRLCSFFSQWKGSWGRIWTALTNLQTRHPAGSTENREIL